MTKNLQPTKEKLPHAPPPIWAPDGADLETLPDELQRAVAEVVQPAYEQLVLAPRDPLERMLGVTASHLLWLESLQQVSLKQEYLKVTAVLGLPDDHQAAIEQHLRILCAKVKLGYLIARLRDQRRLPADQPPTEPSLPHPDPPPAQPILTTGCSPKTDARQAPPPNPEEPDPGDQNPAAECHDHPDHTEKPDLGDQKTLARFHRAQSYLLAHPQLFAAQGSVAATWRSYCGRRLGPYFQLIYRRHGRKRAIYLGRSLQIADRVREILDRLQAPHHRRRLLKRLTARARSSLRLWKDRLRSALSPWGITLKGFEFRGVRRALPTARQSRASHANSQPSSITRSAAPFPLRL